MSNKDYIGATKIEYLLNGNTKYTKKNYMRYEYA